GVVMLLACCPAAGGAGAGRTPAPAPAPGAGGGNFKEESSTLCPGPGGTAAARGPARADNRRYRRVTPEELFDAIKNGIRGTAMPPAALSDEEAWRVVAYIRSLRGTAADMPPPRGDATRGESIFWGKGDCGRCHMVRGRGGLLGPDLSNIGAERRLALLREALVAPRPRIPRGYQPVRIETADGRKIEGLVKNENNFSLQVLGLDLRLHLL